jgi:hypothetical protein
VAVSDFNLDSTYDLAVANGLSNNVSILLGNGAGGFGSATHFAVGTAPFSVAVDDFNNDTASDLATANFAANSVSVRLNICGAQTPTTTPTLSPTDTPVGATATPTATRTLLPTNSPTATVCAIQFSDVPTDHTFYVYIRCLVCRGIVSGYADNTFRPANEVTCGQIAKIVSNSAGYSEPPGPQIFEDVPPGHTFFEFVQRLAYRGILAGYPCGSDVEPCVPPGNLPYFRPANNASRGQLAKIACRAYNCVGIPAEQTFEDVPANHTFYTDVEQLHALGAINGYPCGNPEPCIPPLNRPYFRPSNTVTRGQTAKIVANVFFPDCYTPSMPRQR